MTNKELEIMSYGLSNFVYHGNLIATKQLVELFDNIVNNKKLGYKKPLKTIQDYIDMYDWNFYTYWTWEELVKSEEEQANGMTEKECKKELNHTIFRLPCGWYVQYV